MGMIDYPKKLFRFERPSLKRTDTLRARKLFASKPKYFNDLFDCQLDFDAVTCGPWSAESLAAAVELLYPDGEALAPDFPFKESMIRQMKALLPFAGRKLTLRNDGLSNFSKQTGIPHWLRDSLSDTVAVCCFFAAEPNDPLMWAHYGDNHRGICVEYEICDEPDGLFEVEYSTLRPTVTLTEMLFSPKETALRVLRTKLVSWMYEKEYRIIRWGDGVSPGSNGELIDFPRWLKPVRVYMGARVNNTTEAEDGSPSYWNVSNVAATLGVDLVRVSAGTHALEHHVIAKNRATPNDS